MAGAGQPVSFLCALTMRGELERGREYYTQRKWADAYDSLSRADRATPLVSQDLELLAMAAYLVGRDEEYLSALERAHHAHLDAGEVMRAVRCAFWVSMRLLFRGETGRATGWLARAQRLLEHEPHESAGRSGPIVTMETTQHAADIWLTAYFLLDYQYQLSASLNPAFHGGASATESGSVKLDLLLDIDIRTLSGSPISRAGAMKHIKHAEIQPGSTLPPFIAGTKEIVPGTQLQGGELAVPVTWEHVFSAPANCRVRVGVAAAPFVSASGYRGSKDYRHLCIADGRASGQVTSVEALLFAE